MYESLMLGLGAYGAVSNYIEGRKMKRELERQEEEVRQKMAIISDLMKRYNLTPGERQELKARARAFTNQQVQKVEIAIMDRMLREEQRSSEELARRGIGATGESVQAKMDIAGRGASELAKIKTLAPTMRGQEYSRLVGERRADIEAQIRGLQGMAGYESALAGLKSRKAAVDQESAKGVYDLARMAAFMAARQKDKPIEEIYPNLGAVSFAPGSHSFRTPKIMSLD